MAAKRALIATRMTDGKRSALPPPRAERPERWTADKEARFLTALAVTSNVRASLRDVGMSAASLYHRRRTRPAFQAAWDSALNEGYAKVEARLLEEAINGVPTAVGRAGAEEIELRPASDRVRLTLLAAHAKRVGEIRAGMAALPIDTARLRRELRTRLDRLARALGVAVVR